MASICRFCLMLSSYLLYFRYAYANEGAYLHDVACSDAELRATRGMKDVEAASKLAQCGQTLLQLGREKDAERYLTAALAVTDDPAVMNDLALVLRKLERPVEALNLLLRALDNVPRPWTSLDLEAPSNLLSDVISAPGLGTTVLYRLFRHKVVKHAQALYPNVAVYSPFALARHGAYWLQPGIEAETEASLARALQTWISWAGRKEGDAAEHVTGWYPSETWLSNPPNSSIPRDKLGAYTYAARGYALNLALRYAHDSYEAAYTELHPSLRWLMVGARGYTRQPYPKDIQQALAIRMGAPVWYERFIDNSAQHDAKPVSGAIPRLRLAYVSGDLRRHAIGFMVHGLFARHNRTKTTVSAFNWGSIGSPKSVLQEFRLLRSAYPDGFQPDWSMQKPFHVGDFAARWRQLPGCNASVSAVAADWRHWGHTSRLASAAEHFYNPGAWNTPVGYCTQTMAPICSHIDEHVDQAADVLMEMHQHTRPHVMIDLSGLTLGGFIPVGHARPAPISVHYLSGSESMSDPLRADWKIVDPVVLPPELATWPRYLQQLGIRKEWCSSVAFRRRYPGKCVAHVYTEALAYIPGPFQANTYLSAAGICQARLQLASDGPDHALSPGHAASAGPSCAQERGWCGNKRRLVLIAFHSSFKITPDAWVGWMHVLRRHPTAVLWLLRHGNLQPQFGQRLRASAGAMGIHPSRIVFLDELPRELHWRRVLGGDLFLDAWKYGAHSSGADAMRHGVPVLSLAGSSFSSRVVPSLITSLGSPGRGAIRPAPLLIAHTAMDFEQAAEQLLADKNRLATMKAQLWSMASAPWGTANPGDPVAGPFDYTAVASKLDRAYRVMWDTRRVELSIRPGSGYDVDAGEVPVPSTTTDNEPNWDIARTRRDFHIITGAA